MVELKRRVSTYIYGKKGREVLILTLFGKADVELSVSRSFVDGGGSATNAFVLFFFGDLFLSRHHSAVFWMVLRARVRHGPG